MKIVKALVSVVLTLGATAASAQPGSLFPAATPESVGMSRSALESLDAAVQGYVDRQDAVGAELMVIKDRKTVWHTAHGLRDAQTKAPMEIGGIFCVRSQTKPLVGTAVQMLIDEGKISLDDRAAKFLPEFDSDSHRAITIKNLLEHRSGLKLSSLLSTDHRSLKSVLDVAALASQYELDFEPGTRFSYSDDGTDTLASIVEKVAGMPVADFIESRIIKPVGMRDTMCVLKPGDERLARVNSNHHGSAGAWSRFWSPSDKPLFPYFLGSQSLYSTCEDYAKFLCLWADDGMIGDKRLLSHAAVERGLTPTSAMGFPTEFKGQEVWYAQLWETWVKPGEPPAPPTRIAFGHGGSDGTAAWVWPERNLIVLYFTQSRGGLTSISVESEIDRLLIRGDEAGAVRKEAMNLTGLAGLYWDDEDERIWAVIPAGDQLRMEMQGLTAMNLAAAGDGSWKFELQPGTHVKFDKGPDGVATRFEVGDADKSRTMMRIRPTPDLPKIEKVEAMVGAAHHVDRLRAAVRREGTLKLPAVGIDSAYVEILAPNKSFTEFEARGTRTRILVRDGHVWVRQGAAKAEELTGPRAAQSLFQRSQVIFGGWRAAGADAEVVKRADDEHRAVLLVRLRPPEGNASVLYIEESTGRVVRQDQLVVIPGLGAAVGLTTRFEEFEDVGGALLPRRSTSEYMTPLLGKGETTFATQAPVEGGDGVFTTDGD